MGLDSVDTMIAEAVDINTHLASSVVMMMDEDGFTCCALVSQSQLKWEYAIHFLHLNWDLRKLIGMHDISVAISGFDICLFLMLSISAW